MFRLSILALSFAVLASPALANDPPYLKLAEALGTPHLAESTGPADKSRMLLHFVKDGEDGKNWTKMTTVSIIKVPETDTQGAARGVIVELRDELKENKAKIATFDETPLAPVTCFFEFSADGEDQKGIVYSPSPGFVTVAQVGVKDGATIDPKDVEFLKKIIAPKQ
jgi:hypothetical protein